MTTDISYRSRQYAGESDLQGICDLVNRVDAVDKLDDNYSVDDLRTEFSDPGLDPARDLRVWVDENDQPVAFGQVWVTTDSDNPVADGYFYWRVDPAARGSVEDALFAWAEDRMREVGQERGKPAEVRTSARENYAYGREGAAQRDYEIVRYFFRMARPLDQPIPEPQFPEGFTLRHSAGQAEAAPWVEMYNQSFIDHYNFHPLTVESHQHWQGEGKYSPERDLIAVAPDGTFAAFCFCLIDPDNNERNERKEGWIELLGTRRGYRKIGLGRAMLLAGLRQLKEDGMDTAKLGVDAENPTGALQLYESVGFGVVSTMISYRKSV